MRSTGILPAMLHALLRYLIPLLAVFGVGPLAGHMTGALRGRDGSHDASLLVSSSPMSGVVAALAAFALAAATGCLAARTIGNRSGLFCAGLVLAWAAWGAGRADAILAQPHTDGALRMLALEGLLVGVLGAATALLILRVPTMPSALAATRDPRHEHHHLAPEPTLLMDSTVPIAIAAAALAGAVAVWIIAQEFNKGQTFAAAAIGGIAAASAARIAAPRLSAVWVFVGFILLAAGGPLIASFLHASPRAVLDAALSGRIFFLARPLPLDYLAGAFVGVPTGLVWASSMIDKHAEPLHTRPG